MKIARAGMAVALLVLIATGCQRAGAEETGGSDVASVEPIDGSDVARVTLSQEAADRLDIQTALVGTVRTVPGSRTTIPYAAVLYDPSGQTWTYTSPEPLVFVRARIDVERIDGNRAVLSTGPEPGTKVVVVGAAELLGTEYQVGEE